MWYRQGKRKTDVQKVKFSEAEKLLVINENEMILPCKAILLFQYYNILIITENRHQHIYQQVHKGSIITSS